MTTYRLIAVDDGIERGVGIVDTLELPPDAVLVVSVTPDCLDADMRRLSEELRSEFGAIPGWEDQKIVIVRGGDVRFLRLVPVENEVKPKYPGMMHVTFNEALSFADRVVQELGINRRHIGIRDFDFGNRVAEVYHEMTRIPYRDDEGKESVQE